MKIDIPVSQPYRVDIAPGLLDDLVFGEPVKRCF